MASTPARLFPTGDSQSGADAASPFGPSGGNVSSSSARRNGPESRLETSVGLTHAASSSHSHAPGAAQLFGRSQRDDISNVSRGTSGKVTQSGKAYTGESTVAGAGSAKASKGDERRGSEEPPPAADLFAALRPATPFAAPNGGKRITEYDRDATAPEKSLFAPPQAAGNWLGVGGGVATPSSGDILAPLESNWVTVFGFPVGSAALVLRRFAEFGTIVQHEPGEGNWMDIEFGSALQARRAISRNGTLLERGVMIGVMSSVRRKHDLGIDTEGESNFAEMPVRSAIYRGGAELYSVKPTRPEGAPQAERSYWSQIKEYIFGL